MQENTDISERIQYIIDNEGINPPKFSELLGYKRPQTIYDSINRKAKPSFDFLNRFVNSELSAKYSIDWLISGKGLVFKTDESYSVEIYSPNLSKEEIAKLTEYKPSSLNDLAPYYGVDFTAGNAVAAFDDQTVEPEYFMDIPDFRGCKAFRAYSDSMEQAIKGGSIPFGTKLSDVSSAEFGQVYGIVLNDGRRMLKYLRRHPEDPSSYFLLASENKVYDDMEIKKESVKSLWLIHGHLSKRI